MTKADLIEKIQKIGGYPSKAQAETALTVVISSLVDVLTQGDSVSLPDLGSFKIVERAARKGRNLRTGEEILIPSSKVARFTPSKSLKEKVKSK
ncbi:MAG: HU family DNA-binding protein [Desulfovibrionaceae bacterium]